MMYVLIAAQKSRQNCGVENVSPDIQLIIKSHVKGAALYVYMTWTMIIVDVE